MQPASAENLPALLATARAGLQGGDLADAETALTTALTLHPAHPVALYMMGMLHLRRQNWPEAETCFRQALAVSPGQPVVCLNLSLALRAQHRPTEALDYCRIAVEGAPDDLDAWAELAKAQEESGRAGETEASYRHILARGENAWASASLATLLNQTGRGREAEPLLRQAFAAASGQDEQLAPLEWQMGIALRSQRRHDEALDYLSRSRAHKESRDAALECANVLQHLNRFDDAANIYQELLARNPMDLDVHASLNELYYRHSRDEKLLASYNLAQQRHPQAAALPVAKGQFLLKLGRSAEAHEMFNRALHLAPGDASALMGIGRALENLNDIEAARSMLETGIALHPENGDTLEAFAAFLLRHGDPARARSLAEDAHRLRPASQGALALLSLCYKARGDARYEDLTAYNAFVQSFDLEPPDGYSDMGSFNRDLAAYLETLHTDDREYPFQTVRGGTQLHDQIFYNGHTLVDRLVPHINQAIQTYISRLKASEQHPFVSRRGKGFRYASSWSTRLSDQGFHVNHIHQKGWISSCYYVAVPDAVQNPATREGWIKFGEPSADFGAAFSPSLVVEPRPGRLVLFPSYIWHGTVPFHSPQARTTIAFDAVPAY